MSTYAIGDVQGCYQALRRLLGKIHFHPEEDRLWFTGDLVNRGPQSLAVLRFAKDLGPRAISVLGNHDLHLLAVAGGQTTPNRRDVIGDVLEAPDREELLDWLLLRPLLHHDDALGYTLVHAGLLPDWDLGAARALAAEVEAVLRGPHYRDLFEHMYGDTPDHWDPALTGWERLRVIINAFTRLRYCDAQGRMALGEKGAPGTQAPHLVPWFNVPGRRGRSLKIIFGHWSTLGLWHSPGVVGLDSGCLWGGALSAVRLDAEPTECFSVPCKQTMAPAYPPVKALGKPK